MFDKNRATIGQKMLAVCISLLFLYKSRNSMSDRISQLLDQVREKSILHRDQLVAERSKNETLHSEINTLKTSLSDCTSKIDALNTEVETLKKAQIASKEQNAVATPETGVSDKQIDDLVKEIEYCIGQLKR